MDPVMEKALAALEVIQLDFRISNWLKYADPQAFAQVEEAVAAIRGVDLDALDRPDPK